MDGVLQGHIDGELTEKGIYQAELLGQKLKAVEFNKILSSDLKRASDTTKMILGEKEDKIFYDSGLRERCFGVFEGKKKTEFADALKKSKKGKEYRPVGGESTLDFRKRVERTWKSLIDATSEENTIEFAAEEPKRDLFGELSITLDKKQIFEGFYEDIKIPRSLVVSHSGFIRESLEFFISIGAQSLSSSINNTSLTVIRVFCSVCKGVCLKQKSNCEWQARILLENDTSHLESLKSLP